jgi:hypothetical protein
MGWAALVGAILGGIHGVAKAKKEERDRYERNQFEATRAMYQPWTGNRAQYPGSNPDEVGSMLKGTVAGASFGQQFGGGGGSQQQSGQWGSMAQNYQPNQNQQYA